MSQNKTTKIIILGYFSYLSLFVGLGFISGAIVHTGNLTELSKYLVIGIVGISMFITGSFIQESIINKNNLKEEGVIKFLLYSLVLSIGIGMISGGTQHFTDFPIYSSYLIPAGLLISYFAFLLKNNFALTKKLLIVGGILAVGAIITFAGLNTLAKNLNEQAVKDKAALCAKISFNPFIINVQASPIHGGTNCPDKKQTKILEGKDGCPAGQSKREMPGMCMVDSQLKVVTTDTNHDMSEMVKDDKSFLEGMIPHHIEAINTSKIITQSTQDQELKAFANKVIIDQLKEVELMKIWYKTLTNNTYKDNGTYQPMMVDMNSKMNLELDQSYISGMVKHHKGAIIMAKKVLTVTETGDIKILANNIVTSQATEVETLNNWLNTKFKNLNTPKESDGHTGH